MSLRCFPTIYPAYLQITDKLFPTYDNLFQLEMMLRLTRLRLRIRGVLSGIPLVEHKSELFDQNTVPGLRRIIMFKELNRGGKVYTYK